MGVDISALPGVISPMILVAIGTVVVVFFILVPVFMGGMAEAGAILGIITGLVFGFGANAFHNHQKNNVQNTLEGNKSAVAEYYGVLFQSVSENHFEPVTSGNVEEIPVSFVVADQVGSDTIYGTLWVVEDKISLLVPADEDLSSHDEAKLVEYSN